MEIEDVKTTFPPYPDYKYSGAEWLGKVPAHWEVRRFKFLFKEINEKSVDGSEDLLSVSQYTGVTKKTDKIEDGDLITTASTLEGYKKVYKNDLVSNIMLAWNGSLGFSPYDGITSPAYSVYRLNSNNIVGYFHYLLRSQVYKAEFKRKSSGVIESRLRLYTDDFYAILSILPPRHEQEKIASFLDDKTSKIDLAIAQKEKMIGLLKERKQIIIQNAVTKGLNPNAPTKHSGVEWIGEIPAHWEVKRLRNIFNFSKGLTITKENLQEEGIPCLNYGEIHSKYGFEVNPEIHHLKCVSESYLIDNSGSLINKGDFVFADTSEDLEGAGNFTYLNGTERIFAGYHTIIAKPILQLNSRFMAYVLHSLPFRNQVRTKMKGVKVFSITQSILKDLNCWYPESAEQLTIVNFLDNATAKIDKAIDLQARQIAQLKELKATLIDSAVTGKIKVS